MSNFVIFVLLFEWILCQHWHYQEMYYCFCGLCHFQNSIWQSIYTDIPVYLVFSVQCSVFIWAYVIISWLTTSNVTIDIIRLTTLKWIFKKTLWNGTECVNVFRSIRRIFFSTHRSIVRCICVTKYKIRNCREWITCIHVHYFISI